MPFIATKENGGIPDPNVNRRGRPLKGDEKSITRREAKDKENLGKSRKLKPLTGSAMKHLNKIIEDPKTTEAGRLKAIDMILKYSHLTLESLFAPSARDELPEESTKVEEVQPDSRPVFSLRMINTESEDKTE